MILIRDVFQLKFGKAREAVALWKEGIAIFKKSNFGASSPRILTDLVGTYYTLVFESTFNSLTDYEQTYKKMTANEEWKSWYAKVVPLFEGGRREIFTIVE